MKTQDTDNQSVIYARDRGRPQCTTTQQSHLTPTYTLQMPTLRANYCLAHRHIRLLYYPKCEENETLTLVKHIKK